MREEGLRPREREESEIGVVNAGGEIGAAGNWRRRAAAAATVVGGGAEAGREGGGHWWRKLRSGNCRDLEMKTLPM